MKEQSLVNSTFFTMIWKINNTTLSYNCLLMCLDILIFKILNNNNLRATTCGRVRLVTYLSVLPDQQGIDSSHLGIVTKLQLNLSHSTALFLFSLVTWGGGSQCHNLSNWEFSLVESTHWDDQLSSWFTGTASMIWAMVLVNFYAWEVLLESYGARLG